MIDIDAGVVRELISDQFPRWRHLEVEPVAQQGWDNFTFRLESELAVRLPSAEAYVAAVAKEERVLPLLAGRLTHAVPESVAVGQPGPLYPFPWSVRRWLHGETLSAKPLSDREGLAHDLGRLLAALRTVPAGQGPAAGRHSFFRGCHPSVYGDQVQGALELLPETVDAGACREIWREATATAWAFEPVWFHGDVAAGNLVLQEGRLSAVIDFGTCGVGDPACDLVMAWTYFSGEERRTFRRAVDLPDDSWRRARGWALWKALVTLTGLSGPDLQGVQRRTLAEVLSDPVI